MALCPISSKSSRVDMYSMAGSRIRHEISGQVVLEKTSCVAVRLVFSVCRHPEN